MITLSVHPLSVPPLMMAAIVLYVGMSHLLLFRRRSHRALDLTFALTCFGMGLYDLFCAGLYSASTVAEGVVFQQAQLATLAFTSIFFLLFVASCTGLIRRATCIVFGIYFVTCGVVNMLGESLVLHLHAPLVKHVPLPIIGGVTYYEVATGAWVQFQQVMSLLALFVALSAAYRSWRGNPGRRSRRLMQALSIFAIGAANDAAVSAGLHETIYLMEYCYLAIVLAMTSSLTRELAETEATMALLDETQKRFRSVFSNVAVGIGISTPEGVLVEANSALAAMFGMRVSDIVGTPVFDYFHEHDTAAIRDSLQDLLDGAVTAYRDEKRYIQPGGGVYWGDISAGLMREPSGKARAITWVVVGITERRKAVASLQQVNEELEGRIVQRTTALTEANRRLNAILREVEEGERAAQLIQFSLLPAVERELGGIVFNHFLLPSELMSGDFVDYFAADADRLVFYMADVAGHGVSSAFVTVLVKSFIRGLRDRLSASGDETLLNPRLALQRLNSELLSQDVGKHVTIIYAVIDLAANEMSVATGGHFPHPVLVRDGEAEVLALKGAALGLFEAVEFSCITMELPPRFSLSLFSDGILEILPQQHLKDKQSYLASLAAGSGTSSGELAAKVGLGTGQRPPDDVTILVVRRNGQHV